MSISTKILNSQSLASVAEIERIEFCFCGIDCFDSYIEKAFTASANAEAWKKDKASFLFRKVRSQDTIAIEIYKEGLKVADVIDNTYGSYYASFPNQLLYVGFIADWTSIANSFGHGYYQIKAQKVILGQSQTFSSRNYFVIPYSEKGANETVRIETYTDGNILSSDLNYQSLIEGGWYQSMRISGRFGNVSEVLNQDKVLNADRQVVSVQDSIEREYTLFVNYLPESAKKQLTNDMSLTTRTIITDYNLLNDEVIRQKPVYLESFDEVRHAGRGTAYNLKYKDRFNNTILRTY